METGDYPNGLAAVNWINQFRARQFLRCLAHQTKARTEGFEYGLEVLSVVLIEDQAPAKGFPISNHASVEQIRAGPFKPSWLAYHEEYLQGCWDRMRTIPMFELLRLCCKSIRY